MFQKIARLTLAAALCLAGTACKKAADLDEIRLQKEAKWRERQREQAIKYYADLVKNYPDSPYTAQAQEKVRALQAAAPPKK